MTAVADADAGRAALLKLARDSVTAHLSGLRLPAYSDIHGATRPAAAFVTLRNHGELRGCIGCIEVREPLGAVIVRCTVAAASTDPRVAPVTIAELPNIRIEVSVLGPLEPVETFENITIGRHGLMIESGWSRGLLLPQVAAEWGWDRETFVRQTCVKAGLPVDAWKSGASLFRFDADVFGEE